MVSWLTPMQHPLSWCCTYNSKLWILVIGGLSYSTSQRTMRGNAITHIQSNPIPKLQNGTRLRWVIAPSFAFSTFKRKFNCTLKDTEVEEACSRGEGLKCTATGGSYRYIWIVHGGGDAQGCLPLLWLHLWRTGDLQSVKDQNVKPVSDWTK